MIAYTFIMYNISTVVSYSYVMINCSQISKVNSCPAEGRQSITLRTFFSQLQYSA